MVVKSEKKGRLQYSDRSHSLFFFHACSILDGLGAHATGSLVRACSQAFPMKSTARVRELGPAARLF